MASNKIERASHFALQHESCGVLCRRRLQINAAWSGGKSVCDEGGKVAAGAAAAAAEAGTLGVDGESSAGWLTLGASPVGRCSTNVTGAECGGGVAAAASLADAASLLRGDIAGSSASLRVRIKRSFDVAAAEGEESSISELMPVGERGVTAPGALALTGMK